MIKGLFNFVFIWLLFLASLGFTLYTLQKPGFLVDQARDVRLYERLTGNIGSFFPKEKREQIPLTDAELTDLLTSSVDADTFYGFSDQLVTAYSNYFTSRSETLSFSYNLASVKEKTTAALTAKLIAKYNDLPECKSNQLKNWQADKGLPECQLPSGNVQSNDVNRLLTRQATEATAQWPESVSVPEPNQDLAGVRAKVTQVLRWIYLTWVVLAGFLLLYLLIFRSRGFLSLAIIFLMAGLLEVAFGLIGWEWLARNIIDLVGGQSVQLTGLSTDLAAAIAQVLKKIMGTLSIITLSLGGLFLIVGLISKFKRGTEALTPRQ